MASQSPPSPSQPSSPPQPPPPEARSADPDVDPQFPIAPADDPGLGRPSADDLPAVRALILAAYPDLVPDLVAGDSVASLLASVDGARAAFAAVAERMTPRPAAASGASPGTRSGEAAAVHPPAGGGAPLPIDPDRLPASEKIRRGLRANLATAVAATPRAPR